MSSQASPARKESSEVGQVVLEMSSSLPSSSGTFNSANEDSPTSGVNENTPPVGSLKRELYTYALKGNWEGAKSIHDKFPEMIPMQLTVNGDTALHIAARANNTIFVQELVKMLKAPEDLEITNSNGNTAFCMAAMSGNADLFQTMIEKNKNLPQIRGHDNMLPIHLAALNGHCRTVQDLSTEDHLEKMADKDIERLFFITISCHMYDVATKLLEKYPARLVIARDDQEQLTALHILARKPAQFGSSDKLLFLQKLSDHVRQLEYEIALDLLTKPSKVIFDAVKEGNIQTVKCLLYMIPELLEQKESNGQNSLHIAVLYRQKSIFQFILKTRTADLLMREVDNDRNNVLHLAAQLSSEERSSNLRASIRLVGDSGWFEEVKKRVSAQLRTMKNNKGQIPQETFFADHKELLTDAKEAAKGIAKPSMLVATLIATVVFPAAFDVPGGDSTNKFYDGFVVANAFALFTSSASLLIFLTVYISSWFSENEHFISPYGRLTLGLVLLVVSVEAMIFAVLRACYMIYHKNLRAQVVVSALSLVTIMALISLLHATTAIVRERTTQKRTISLSGSRKEKLSGMK